MTTTIYINTDALGKVASTQASYVYNSLFRFNGKVFGCNDDGLFECCGTTIDGEPIQAYFKTFNNKLNWDGNKRVRFLHVGIEADGDVDIAPSVDDVEKNVATVSPTRRQYLRIAGRRDEHGAYWSYEVSNVEGSWFSVDSIRALPVNLNKGIY